MGRPSGPAPAMTQTVPPPPQPTSDPRPGTAPLRPGATMSGGRGPAGSESRRAGHLRRARGIAIASIALTVVIGLGLVPGFVGASVATALPWLGYAVAVLLLVALLVRRRVWLVALVPALAWAVAVGPSLAGISAASFAAIAPGGSATADTSVAGDAANGGRLVVASQNVEAGSGTAGASAAALVESGAQVIALTELDAEARGQAADALVASHPYSYAVGTVGIWSSLPLSGEQPLELGLGWNRALTVDVETPTGPVTVYVVHAASLRPGLQSDRDTMLAELGARIADDDAERVVALGDFNAASTDPALAGIRAELSEPAQSSPSFGFTWPTAFPLARIDHVFQRGLTPIENTTEPAGSSDNLAVIAAFGL
jgi:vancomycin resistance protein VanJ